MSSSAVFVSAVVLCAAMAGSPASAQVKAKERARIVFSQSLPRLDGDHLKATVVEVNYRPGESSSPHSHPCAVTGYVIEGALRTQVKGDAEAIYKAGESFYEAANGIHIVSANASQTKPAKFIAYFVCDRDTPLSVKAPQNIVTETKSLKENDHE
jgi:quercetin dioxygenase-like cupin family protein